MTGDSPARILLVEDFEDAREMYAEFLCGAGHSISAAADGQQALDMAEHGGFDLIILDIALPKVSGITVIRRLRTWPQTKETPIITLSASVDDDTRYEAVNAGANLSLEKPCLPDELAAAVRKLLR
jgi:DNA-binding response OmpR family regulator